MKFYYFLNESILFARFEIIVHFELKLVNLSAFSKRNKET